MASATRINWSCSERRSATYYRMLAHGERPKTKVRGQRRFRIQALDATVPARDATADDTLLKIPVLGRPTPNASGRPDYAAALKAIAAEAKAQAKREHAYR